MTTTAIFFGSFKVEYWETHDATVTQLKCGNFNIPVQGNFLDQSYRTQGTFHMIEG